MTTRTKTRILLFALMLIELGLVVFAMEAAVLASETAFATHKLYIQMCEVRDYLWYGFWLLQIPISWVTWLVLRDFWAYRGLWRIPVSILGSFLFSLGTGIVVLLLGEHEWNRILRWAVRS